VTLKPGNAELGSLDEIRDYGDRSMHNEIEYVI